MCVDLTETVSKDQSRCTFITFRARSWALLLDLDIPTPFFLVPAGDCAQLLASTRLLEL